MSRPKWDEKVKPAVDRQNGRVLVLDGDMFFSPNCSRMIPPPPPSEAGKARVDIFSPPRLRNGIRNIFDLDIHQFHHPRWWTLASGWASFLQLEPNFRSPGFEALLMIPRHIQPRETDGSFLAPADIIDAWALLENNLRFAVCHLQGYYGIGAIRPFLPFQFAFNKPQRHPQSIIIAMSKARDWFSIWMGLLSYVIARAETIYHQLREYAHLAKMKWDDFLAWKGMDRTWLDTIKTSALYTYAPSVSRSGVFVTFDDVREDQPDVSWFYEMGVPIWYRWNSYEARNSYLAGWAPLPHQLQTATTFAPIRPITTSLQLVPSSTSTSPQQASNAPPSNTVTTVPASPASALAEENLPAWKIFFVRRAEANMRLAETDAQRQARLARERNPPTVSAKVFKWVRHNITGALVREDVPRKWRESILSDYGSEQKCYDSYANEWDCCSDFGQDDQSSDAGDCEDIVVDYDGLQNDEQAGASVPNTLSGTAPEVDIVNAQRAEVLWLPKSAQPAYAPTASLFEKEIIDLTHLLYGFTVPIPLANNLPAINDIGIQKNLLKLLGLSVKSAIMDVFTVNHPFALAAMNFLQRLSTSSTLLSAEYDLHRDHTQHVAFRKRFSCIEILHKDSKPIFMFNFRDRRTVDWNLAVSSASTALMICRMQENWHERDIALELLRNGTPFRTLQASSSLRRSPLTSVDHQALQTPSRPASYTFTLVDYAAYLERKSVVQRHPRARAALLRGGYIWRACVSSMSFERVLDGPSGWSPNPKEIFIVTSPSGDEYIDDELLDLELETLCGLYRCMTGEGDQIALKSWCPLWSTFEGSGIDYGRWTGINEDIYEISASHPNESGAVLKRQPCSAKKWRDICRGLNLVRVSSKTFERAAQELLLTSRPIVPPC